MSQMKSFDEVIKYLNFDVDIFKQSDNVINAFKTLSFIKYKAPGGSQSSLTLNMELGTNKPAKMYKHLFYFAKSPIEGLNIESGHIEIKVGKADGIDRIIDTKWLLVINGLDSAITYFEELKELFAKLSTKKKNEFDKVDGQYVSEFSTDKEKGTNVHDISIILSQSERPNFYEVQLFLMNEFMD